MKMKKLSIYLIVLFLVPTFIFTGCKDDEVVEPAIITLTKYMTANSLDLPNIIGSKTDGTFFATAAPATDGEVAAWAASFYIMDIRSTEVFDGGHIVGAHNVLLSNILTEASSADKPILVVCYTGQTACYATSLLRLYGYPTAKALKWGMCGWNETFAAKWNAQIGSSHADGSTNWSDGSAPTPVIYDLPVLTESGTDGATILNSRVDAVVAAGFSPLSATDVLTTPTNYFINNYFSDAHYTGFGHIDGAHRISPLSIADDYIKNLDPNAKVVTYCYTGQTSAVITAYLNVLGYDAYSMTFGMNGIYNDNDAWSTNQWGADSNPKDLNTVKD